MALPQHPHEQVLVLSQDVGEIRAALAAVTALAAPTAAGPAGLTLSEKHDQRVANVAVDAITAVRALNDFVENFAALLRAVEAAPNAHPSPGMLRGPLRRELRHAQFVCSAATRRCEHVQALGSDEIAEGDTAPCLPMRMIERVLGVLREKCMTASERLTGLDAAYSPPAAGPAGRGESVAPAQLRAIDSFEKSREGGGGAAPAAPGAVSKE